LPLFDSTIVIDHLNGVAEATALFRDRPAPTISIVTWIEAAAGLGAGADAATGRAFLSTLKVIPLSQRVAEEAVNIRRTTRLKLPDSVILASARVEGLVLLTRNTKDFSEDDPDIEVPYRL
jgi:hypothetical protein